MLGHVSIKPSDQRDAIRKIPSWCHGYNSSEISEIVLTDTLAGDTPYSFYSIKSSGGGRLITEELRGLARSRVCRSSAFMQGFKAYRIQFSLPDRKLLFLGGYVVLARFRVWLRWILIQKCCFRCLKRVGNRSLQVLQLAAVIYSLEIKLCFIP